MFETDKPLVLDDNAEKRLAAFATLKDGWDCGRGKSLNPYSLKQLRNATMLALPDRYSVFMNDDGELTLEWSDGERDVVAQFYEDRVEIDLGFLNPSPCR